MTSPVARDLQDIWRGYVPAYETAYNALSMTFRADCPTPGCGRVIQWIDSKVIGPRPGPCDCEIKESAA